MNILPTTQLKQVITFKHHHQITRFSVMKKAIATLDCIYLIYPTLLYPSIPIQGGQPSTNAPWKLPEVCSGSKSVLTHKPAFSTLLLSRYRMILSSTDGLSD